MALMGLELSGHYNRPALISVDIISGVCCTSKASVLLFRPFFFA